MYTQQDRHAMAMLLIPVHLLLPRLLLAVAVVMAHLLQPHLLI